MKNLMELVVELLDKYAKLLVNSIEDPECKLFFTLWDLVLKGAWNEFTPEMKEWVHSCTGKFGGCSLQIYWTHENYFSVGDEVVYLVAPTKVTMLDQQDGHWMNITKDGEWFCDGYGNWIEAKEIGNVIELKGKVFYVARKCNIKDVAPNLGVQYIMCNLLREIYFLKDNGAL